MHEYSQQLHFYRPGLETNQMSINWQVGNKTGWVLTVEDQLAIRKNKILTHGITRHYAKREMISDGVILLIQKVQKR